MLDGTVIERLAALSRIAIEREEAEHLGQDIEHILNYVSEIREAEIDMRPGPEMGAVYNVLREDDGAHTGGVFSQLLLRAARESEGKFIKVKKIL